MHKKKRFICVLAVTILHLKVKYRSFGSKHMRDKFINSEACKKQKCRKDVVLVAIFSFAYLEVKDTKHRIVSNSAEFSTHKLC